MTDRYFAPVPARRLALVRSLTFGYAAVWLVARARYVWDVGGLPDRRFQPVGVLTVTAAPPGRPVVMVIWAVALTCSVAVAAGRAIRVTAPVGAAAVLLTATVTSSFGQVFHTEHLLVLHLGILAVASWSPDVGAPRAAGTISGWPLRLMMATVAAVYVVAGVAKLRHGGTAWLTGDVLRAHVAADNLRKLLLDDLHSPLGGWLSGVGWLWPPIGTLTIAVEVGAPIALLGGRVRSVWIGTAWLFHVGVLVLMAITFPYQLTGVAYAAFLPVERVVDRARALPRPILARRRAPAL
jgi:hypothetical protein